MMNAAWFICSPEFWRMSVFWTLSLVFSFFHLLFGKFQRSNGGRLFIKSVQNSSKKPICVITGPTSGLGLAAAHALSREGFCVVLAGRSPHALSKVTEEIKGKNEIAFLKTFELDMSSMRSIVIFVESLERWISESGDLHPSIQLLINNAAILSTSRRLTPDGLDAVMATNYIGPFLLCGLLFPLLRNSPVPSRVVNVTSFTHRNVRPVHFDKPTVMGKCFTDATPYPFARAYEFSKLNVADPGAVRTAIMRDVPPSISRVAFAAMKMTGLLKSPEDGVQSILDAALACRSGMYFFGGGGRTIRSSAASYSGTLALQLWDVSSHLLLDTLLVSSVPYVGLMS